MARYIEVNLGRTIGIAFGAAVAVVAIVWLGTAVADRINDSLLSQVTNFEQCKQAGGRVAESYPEQCRIDDKMFVNQAQIVDESDGYVGMTEQDALAKAEAGETSARVVERNGRSLPTTMDLRYGRLNLYVRDGIVYKVVVEGKEEEVTQ